MTIKNLYVHVCIWKPTRARLSNLANPTQKPYYFCNFFPKFIGICDKIFFLKNCVAFWQNFSKKIIIIIIK